MKKISWTIMSLLTVVALYVIFGAIKSVQEGMLMTGIFIVMIALIYGCTYGNN